ncbi:MAG TPA: heme ABC transporter ATP-binding protein, partial [Clostridiales bacterium]|nr:heme ABC transporter ATP-binding protein [Clostridiales bacterium]
MEPVKGISLDYKKARKDVLELEKRFGMEVPLDALAGSLAVGLQQKVEILKILYRGAEILILDEP